MKPAIPKNGFFAAKMNKLDDDLIARLKENSLTTAVFHQDHLVLAANSEFEGQGLWQTDNTGVAYDLDLTNAEELYKLVEEDQTADSDFGFLIFKLYKKFGLDFLDRLRGAFAFALWDGTDKIMITATDAFGIRPVVYSRNGEEFLCASRISMLCYEKRVSRELNPDAVYHYLFFHAVCSPISIYQSVNKLEPGKMIQISSKGFREIQYYDIKYSPDPSRDQDDWAKQIFSEVEKAVNTFSNLSDHERTGCFLSGGTDSSTIAGMYTRLRGKPAQTFSIGFDDKQYNELDFAKIAVDHFNTKQTEYIVTPEDTIDLITQLPEIYDEPFGNASVVPAFYCAMAAKNKGVDILLGGDGGDEIFGGNERYVKNLVFDRYRQIPKFLRQMAIEPMFRILPDMGLFYKASRYIRRANFLNPYRFYSYNLLAETDNREILNPDFISRTDINSFLKLAGRHYEQAAPAHDTDRLLYIDMKFTITDNDLRKVTQMAESSGVRVRYPYLDRDLVDFTATIPPDLKVKPGKNRFIFKQAMKNFLPEKIITKPKHGMGLPISNWFRTERILSELLKDTLFIGKPMILDYIQPGFLDTVYASFRNIETTAYYGDTLWVYLMLELWLKKNCK